MSTFHIRVRKLQLRNAVKFSVEISIKIYAEISCEQNLVNFTSVVLSVRVPYVRNENKTRVVYFRRIVSLGRNTSVKGSKTANLGDIRFRNPDSDT